MYFLYAYNYFASFVFSKLAKNKPLLWHNTKPMFSHYHVLLPKEISLLADKEVIRAIMKEKFKYFHMTSGHEETFMTEFYQYLLDQRKGLYTSVYEQNTSLSKHEIEQRVSTIMLIEESFEQVYRLEQLIGFFRTDWSLNDSLKTEMDRYLMHVLLESSRLKWGRA